MINIGPVSNGMFWSYLASFLIVATMLSVILYAELKLSKPETVSKQLRYALNFVLFMMATMFIGLLYYYSYPPSFLNAIIAVNIIMVPMISFIFLLFYIYSIELKIKWNVYSIIFPTYFIINESLMSIFVLMILGFKIHSNPFLSLPLTVNSLVFIVPMEIEMIFSILFFRVKGTVRYLLIVLAGMDIVSPALYSTSDFLLLVINALIMVAGMVIIFETTASSKNKIVAEKNKIINISMAVYLLNSIGFFVFYTMGSNSIAEWFPYCISIIIGMWLYFFFILSPRDIRTMDGWIKRRWWLFFLLAISFSTEIIMSIPINIMSGIFVIGGQGLSSFSYLLITNAGVVNNFYISIIPFIGAVAGSPTFLILMGLEMGSLVVFRIKRIKWFEKRINLAFALIAFATYTIFAPTYVGRWPMVPLWANLGAQGPVAGVLIAPMLLSYLVYAILVLLFGRRAYCGVLCPSAVMYGGTLGQEMISLNYKTKASRKMIGSSYSPFIQKVAAGSWGFMFISGALSFLISVGKVQLPFDTAALYSSLVWNVLWYIFFIAMPFVGMSPCRRTGWCTTGTFVGFLGKLGLFRIKAVDPNVCFKCPTKDCVTACEVGLGDLPGQFIKNGFFKSQKCVGSGSCISACPYNNIHFYDIRHVLREKLTVKHSNVD